MTTKDKTIRCSKCGQEIEKAGYCKPCKSYYNKQYRQSHNDKQCGVYVILDDGEIKYIGSSRQVKTRIENHLRGYTLLKDHIENDSWDSIYYYPCNSEEECRWLEAWLIDQLPLNLLWNDRDESNVLKKYSLGYKAIDEFEDESNWICYKYIDR